LSNKRAKYPRPLTKQNQPGIMIVQQHNYTMANEIITKHRATGATEDIAGDWLKRNPRPKAKRQKERGKKCMYKDKGKSNK
jgi:hypothetical protein